MKALIWIAGGLAAIALVIVVVGWLLPVKHEASRSASLNRSAEDVYAMIADVSAYAQWWPDVTRVEMLPAEAGVIRFREHMSSGPIVMEVVAASPPARFVTKIADPDQPFGGTWTFDISRESSATRLTITEHGEVYNPIFRFMSRFVFGHTGTMESFLRALRARLGA
jgi:uncharacterized protein YndB with AHSA1/START domain